MSLFVLMNIRPRPRHPGLDFTDKYQLHTPLYFPATTILHLSSSLLVEIRITAMSSGGRIDTYLDFSKSIAHPATQLRRA